ncbi:MAG TPA: peptidoglycan DD-metalloendopeptidase family protein, partial [Thermoleophilaceae bacterium]|nr:peptidoglycan DD-metalloendopeptidase family protein [Thermoleophilaceae bacterium]
EDGASEEQVRGSGDDGAVTATATGEAVDLSSPEYGSRRMRSGDRGGDVAKLQRYLSRLGLSTPVDGIYGRRTRINVERYEAWRYLRSNGKVNLAEADQIRRDARRDAQYRARRHAFPVRGPHDYGGSGSRFGAPRAGHTHQGQDVAAAYKTKLVAVHNGKVAYRQYQAGGAGHYLVIHGRDGRDSVYMHMPRASHLEPGERVRAGEMIGRVGCTGTCTGPHLHFELWTPHWYAGGAPYDPLPYLKRWDRQS